MVWARLRISGVRTSRRRVLRLMREHGLLSPRTRPTSCGAPTARACRPQRRACAFVFTAVDHYSCEVVGRHVCKRGDRFAALQPVAQGLARHFGGVGANAGRGLSLRMDNGT